MKSYSKYKPINIDRITEIPEHWKAERIKRRVTLMYGDSLPSENRVNGNYNVYGSNGIVGQHISYLSKDKTIIIGRKGSAGAINFSLDSCFPIDTTFYINNISTMEDLRWLYYSLQILNMEQMNNDSAVPGLNRGQVYNINFPFPPLPEQKAIAEYLDKTTQAIDSTIAIKEKQIETIEQYFRSKLHEVVTGGLNQNVKRKPSGVELIGDIPINWKVERIKNIANIRYGLGQPPQEKDDGLPLIRATNIHYGTIYEEKMIFVDPNAIPPGRDAVLREGEIIIVRSGAYTGDSAIIPKRYEGAITGYDMVLNVTQAYNKFIAWQILTEFVQEHQFVSQSQRAAQPHLNAEQLGKTIVVIPPLSEQKAIAEYLDSLREKVESITKTLREQVEVLKDYRKSLIHECVTGKRKVI